MRRTNDTAPRRVSTVHSRLTIGDLQCTPVHLAWPDRAGVSASHLDGAHRASRIVSTIGTGWLECGHFWAAPPRCHCAVSASCLAALVTTGLNVGAGAADSRLTGTVRTAVR